MKWTREKPTEPGWYPLKEYDEEWEVVQIKRVNSILRTGLCVFHTEFRSSYLLNDCCLDAQWSDPIEEPTDE